MNSPRIFQRRQAVASSTSREVLAYGILNKIDGITDELKEVRELFTAYVERQKEKDSTDGTDGTEN